MAYFTEDFKEEDKKKKAKIKFGKIDLWHTIPDRDPLSKDGGGGKRTGGYLSELINCCISFSITAEAATSSFLHFLLKSSNSDLDKYSVTLPRSLFSFFNSLIILLLFTFFIDLS